MKFNQYLRIWVISLCFLVLTIGGCVTESSRPLGYTGSVLDGVNKTHRLVAAGAALSPGLAPGDAIAQQLNDAYDAALNKCGFILSKYENKADVSRKWLLGISILGAVAGGVIAPTLLARTTIPKGAVAAWSGVAGVSNLAQQAVVNEGLDPNSLVTTRSAIVSKMQQYITDYAGAQGNLDKQQTAIANLEGACVAYDIAKASQEVNSFTPSTTPSPKAVGPGPVTNIVPTPAATSVSVAFTPPSDTGSNMAAKFTVTLATGNAGDNPQSQSGDKSPIVVTGLKASTGYNITIVASNKAGDAGTAAKATVTTLSN
jgi:hypothetical protein